MSTQSIGVAVIMERRALANPWQSEQWNAVAVVPDTGDSGPQLLIEDGTVARWLYPGFSLTLQHNEAEGYYLNVSAAEPQLFVMWRMGDERAVPQAVSASYNDAGTWLDGSEEVDPVPMPQELRLWVGDYVRDHYKPEPRKRIKPQAFMHPKDRAKQ